MTSSDQTELPDDTIATVAARVGRSAVGGNSAAGLRVGEGVGASWEQVADLVRRAWTDAVGPLGTTGRGTSPTGLNGADREQANDAALLAAGIPPGHPSLYPRSLEDAFAANGHLKGPDSSRSAPR